MIIRDHRLAEPPDGIDLRYVEGTWSSLPFNPEIAVVHYGVVHTIAQLLAAQKERKFYAHVTQFGRCEEDEDGELSYDAHVVQTIPFDKRGAHCGPSDYKGKPGSCNAIALGIEIVNPGPLIRGADGLLRTVYGKVWPEDDAIEAKHKSGRAPTNWTHWAKYSRTQVDLAIHTVALWKQEYGITDVVGHDDIAPTRKFDPGPAFPIDYVREVVFS